MDYVHVSFRHGIQTGLNTKTVTRYWFFLFPVINSTSRWATNVTNCTLKSGHSSPLSCSVQTHLHYLSYLPLNVTLTFSQS